MESRFKAPPSAYDWTITVGVEGRSRHLLGSKDFTVRPNPLFDIPPLRHTPSAFRAPRDGLP
jgi:hypothetical protein